MGKPPSTIWRGGGRWIPDGNWLEVTRLNHNLGKIHDAPVASFELVWKDGRSAPDAAKVLRSERLDIEGARSARWASART